MWDDGRTDSRKRPDRTAVFIRTTARSHRLSGFHVILSKPEAQSKDPVGCAHIQCVQGAFLIVTSRRPLGVVPAMHEIPFCTAQNLMISSAPSSGDTKSRSPMSS